MSLAKRGIGRPRPMAEELHNALSDYIQRYTWHPSQKIKELAEELVRKGYELSYEWTQDF